MTTPAAEAKAIEIVDAFFDTQFDEGAEAAEWLKKHIAEALAQFERGGTASAARRVWVNLTDLATREGAA